MPKSSRHKSSKHSSRDAREYSDSEKDSILKERKVKEESSSRVSKDSDKRKLDSKDVYGAGNGEYPEEYGSSKRRKERAADDGVSDRWNGGEEDRSEVSRKSKSSSDSKSKRKEESEGKHRESSRKERESGGERDRERKGKEGKSDKLVVNEEERTTKLSREIIESNAVDAEPDNQLERRNRRRRDGSGDGDKHLDDVGDAIDRRLSSKDDSSKDGKQKDEKHKDERYRDKYREDLNWDNKHRDDKQRDERPPKDHASGRSDEKHLRDDKNMSENRQKKSKPQDHDRERESDRDHDLDSRDRDHVRDRYHDHDHERESERNRDRDRDRNRNLDRDYDRDHDWDRDEDWDRDRDRNRERGRDRERNRDRDRETDRDRERDYDHEGSYLDDRSARYKDRRGRKRSPDDHDYYNDSKHRVTKDHYSDMEKKPLSSRVESEADRGRSQSRQIHVDSSSNKRRNSPNSSSHVGTDEYRYFKSEESKYRDSVTEPRSKAISSREVTGLSGVSERSSKYRSIEKPNKGDDGHVGEPVERSSSSKASPMGFVERSPSSTSVERRHINRSGVRRGLDVDEPGRRSGASFDDRLGRDLPSEKPVEDDPSQADSSFHNRTSQSNSSIPPLPGFRPGVDSPSYKSSLEEDNRFNSNSRYKRGGDSNMARGHGNAWRGIPSWSSPMPNGFMPFQHGPPLGGFQGMMPQFPSPPLFGVRPSMEMNHAGMPYHIPDTDRFSGHMRPLGWQNMMDGSGPSHMHGWDGNNGGFRDEPHMYGAPDWDQNRHPMNRRSWETGADMWKEQNGDVNREPSASLKEDHPVNSVEDELSAGQVGLKSQLEQNHVGVHAKDVEARPDITSAIENSQAQSTVVKEKMPESSKKSSFNDVAQLSRAYLSKLDISRDLAYQELYIQCRTLLDLEEEATDVEDVTTRVNLNGRRARLKTSFTLQSPSLFPTSKQAVFQRAMDLYKKQCVDSSCVPIVSREVVNDVTATSLERGDDNIPNHNEGKEGEQLPTSIVEVTDASVSASDQVKPEAETTATTIKEEPEEDTVPTSDLEVQNHVLTPSPVEIEEAPTEDCNHKNPEEEPFPISNFVKEDGMVPELVKPPEAAEADCISTPNDSPHTGSMLPACIENNNDAVQTNPPPCSDDNTNSPETNGDHSTCSGEGTPTLHDGVNGNLCCSDGTSKALKPESNDSESVVLSRIHHSSPESTH